MEATLASHAVCCRCLRAGKRRLHRYETRGDEALFMLEQRVARGLRDEEGRVQAARGLDEAEPDVDAVADVA